MTASKIAHKRYEYILRGQKAGAVVENIKRIPEKFLPRDISLTANTSQHTETAAMV